MKKNILSIVALLMGVIGFAQMGFNYKALITDSGNALANQSVNIRFTVLENGTTAVYQETQTATTDANGIVSTNIGEGTVVSGDFNTVNWVSRQSLKVEIDSGSGYQDYGTNPLKWVPTAKYASKAGSVDFSNITNVPADLSDGDDDTHLTDAQIAAMGYIKNPNDADHDASNELQTISKSGNTVTLSNGGGSFTDAVNDADHSTTNELQTLAVSGNQLSISNGNTVTLPTGSGGDQWGSQVVQSNNTLTGDGTSAHPLAVDTSSSAFANWDKNTADDFSGDYTDLANKPDVFRIQGTANPATSYTDDIKHSGDVLIGDQFSTDGDGVSSLRINRRVNNENSHGFVAVVGGSGSQDHYGGYIKLTDDGEGNQTGIRSSIENTGDGSHFGIFSGLNGSGSGEHLGMMNYLYGSGTGVQYGIKNWINISGDATHYGSYSYLNGSGSGTHNGTYNKLSGTGTGEQYGVHNYIDNTGYNDHVGSYSELSGSGSGFNSGTYNHLYGTGTGNQYGINNDIENSGNGDHYGSNSFLNGSGSGEHYGAYNQLSGTGTGIQYGVENMISNSGNANHYGSYSSLSGIGSGYHYGAYNILTGDGTGEQYGVKNEISNSGNANHFGSYSALSGSGSGKYFGTYNYFSGDGTGEQYGIKNWINNSGDAIHYGSYLKLSGTGSGLHYGSYSELSGSGSGYHYGAFNELSGDGSGMQIGVLNDITNSGNHFHYGNYSVLRGSGSGTHFCAYNQLSGAGTGEQYGVYNYILNSGNGSHFGNYSYLKGSGSGNKYGTYAYIKPSAGGTHYAIYGNATKIGSYAGYFVGDVKMTQKLKASTSGDADMKAYIYGKINGSSSGVSIDASKSSSGFSVGRVTAGKYRVTLSELGITNYVVTANVVATAVPRIVTYVINSNSFDIYIWKLDGTLMDADVSFVVYKK